MGCVSAGGVGARLVGLDFLDPIAGILVGAMIIKAGASIGLESLQELTDQSMDKELLDEVSAEVRALAAEPGCSCVCAINCHGVGCWRHAYFVGRVLSRGLGFVHSENTPHGTLCSGGHGD